MTKSEIIAEFQKYVAFSVVVSVYGKRTDLKRDTSVREIRETILSITGEKLTAKSIEKALFDPDGFPLGDQLSCNGADSKIKLSDTEIEYFFEALSRVDESLVARVEQFGFQEVRSDLAMARREAAEYFEGYRKIDDRLEIPSPLSRWTSLGMRAVKGHVVRMAERDKRRSHVTNRAPRENGSIDWQKWGALAGIGALPLAILIWWLS